MKRSLRYGLWCVLAAAAVLFLVNFASIPLTDPDESRFARTSLEMLRNGEVVVPSFEGKLRLTKPPLVHWIQSALFALFGAEPWVARFHSVLASLGSLCIVGWIARRRFGDEAAVWAVTLLATSPLFLLCGRLGTLDALLAVHVLAAIAFDIVERDNPGPYRGIAVGAILGLAFLVKGPVGVIVPLLVMLAGRTATGRPVLPASGDLLRVALACCAVVLPWGVALVARVGLGPVVAVVREEALERYFAGTTHVEPFWFYAVVVAVGFLPWAAPLVLALLRVVQLRRDPATTTARYVAAGLLAGLIFFSLSRGKLPSYILPLAPLAALLVTWHIGHELRSRRPSILGSSLIVATLLVVAVGIGGLLVGPGIDAAYRPLALGVSAIFFGGALIALPGLVRRRPRWVYGVAAVSTALFLGVTVGGVLPRVAQTRTSAYLIENVPELSTARPLVVVDMKLPSLTFYLDRVAEQVDMALFAERLERRDDPLFILDEVDLAAVSPSVLSRLRRVGGQGKFVVFEKAFREAP